MPELAEVAFYAKAWHPAQGQTILRVHTGPKPRFFRHTPAAAFAPALTGRSFLDTRTHGKKLLFAFQNNLWLTGHLGMTGELLLAPPDHLPTAHDHLVLYTAHHALIFRDSRMFGAVLLDESPGPPPAWQALPPEILSPQFTAAHAAAALQRHPRSPLKAFLLDQTYFPGIGNWMADEVLFQLRLHPATLAASVNPSALRQALRTICQKSLQTIAINWSDPPKNWLMTHRWKAGGLCPRCYTPLLRDTLRGRTACWCPTCQPQSPP